MLSLHIASFELALIKLNIIAYLIAMYFLIKLICKGLSLLQIGFTHNQASKETVFYILLNHFSLVKKENYQHNATCKHNSNE